MINLLLATGLIPESDARKLLSVLRRIIIDSESDPQAVEAFREVVGRLDGDEILQSCADWWLRVYTGFDPATPFAFAPSELLNASVRDRMTTIVMSRFPSPIRESWQLRSSLSEQLVEVDSLLSLENHGNILIAQEHLVWRLLVDQIRPHLDAARRMEVLDLDYPSEREFKQSLRDHDVVRGSQVWNKLTNLRAKILEGMDDLRRVVEQVAGFSNADDLPEPLGAWPDDLQGAGRDLERAFLGDLVVDDPEALTHTPSAEAVSVVGVWATNASGPVLVRLATIVDTWPARTSISAVELDRVLGRMRDFNQRVNRLERQGVDVEEARATLEVMCDIDGALVIVNGLESERHMGRQAETLRGRVRSLRKHSQSVKEVSDIDAALNEIERQLSNHEVLAAEKSIAEVERELKSRLRNELESFLNDVGPRVEVLRSHRLANGESISEFQSAATAELSRLGNGLRNDLPEIVEELQQFRQWLDDVVRSTRSMLEDLLRGVTTMAFEVTEATDDDDAEADSLSWAVVGVRAEFDELEEDAGIEEIAQVLREVEQCYDDAAQLKASLVGLRFTDEDTETDLLERIVAYCTQEYAYNPRDVRRLYVSLKSKPFVILTGLAGSGKSTIARLVANAIGSTTADRTFERIAVRPDWIDQSEVLGYLNPVNNSFQPGWLAVTVRECLQRPNDIFFVLLDEMNLAPIEQYLAEYLSAAEEHRSGSDEVYMSLYREGSRVENSNDWPPSLRFPDNLIVIGTANVDETTRVLSDRVLDRANIIQLSSDISYEHHSPRTPGSVQPWTVAFDRWRRLRVLRSSMSDEYHDFLVETAAIMRDKMRIGLGVRSHIEMERYVEGARSLVEPVEALDDQMLQRVIPKIRGYRYDIEDGLRDLRDLWRTAGLARSVAVLDDWLAEDRSPDSLLDGLSVTVGMVSSGD